jgi:putative glutathione S-transferase
MGMLVEGKWTTKWYEPDEKGRFVRGKTAFRDAVTADGSSGHPAEAGRYHLYVAWACPWAHRALLGRTLKGLEKAIDVSIVDAFMGDDGWTFGQDEDGIPDPIHGARFLRDVYLAAQPDFTGRVTVPVLWDKTAGTIVNNESREILRMFDTAFDGVGDAGVNLLPAGKEAEVDRTIDEIYEPVNNGVYRSGFARSQEAYDEAVTELFGKLDELDARLGERRYLCGEVVTEADICLFTTLIRFDLVYHGHFKCNLRRISDYPNLSGYVRELWQVPAIQATCNLPSTKRHYYASHESVNPTRIVPVGPDLSYLDAPHGRERVGGDRETAFDRG